MKMKKETKGMKVEEDSSSSSGSESSSSEEEQPVVVKKARGKAVKEEEEEEEDSSSEDEDKAVPAKKADKKKKQQEQQQPQLESSSNEDDAEPTKEEESKKRKREGKKAGDDDDDDKKKKKKDNNKKVKKDDSATQDEDGEAMDEERNKYSKHLVFVGQIPFKAKVEDIKKHFAKYGVHNTEVRLLTNKETKRSRGIAFVQLTCGKDVALALRVHHTRLFGRMLNVERTCGGGGNSDARKERLKALKDMQNKKVLKEVEETIKEVLNEIPGTVAKMEHFDERVIEALGTLPRDVMRNIIVEFGNEPIDKVQNPPAFIMGMVKKYRDALKDSEDFVADKVKGPRRNNNNNRNRNHHQQQQRRR